MNLEYESLPASINVCAVNAKLYNFEYSFQNAPKSKFICSIATNVIYGRRIKFTVENMIYIFTVFILSQRFSW